jgi:hypothetical protein
MENTTHATLLARIAEGVDPLLNAYEVFSNSDPARSAYLEHVISKLIELYEATGRKDEASRYKNLLGSL